MSDARLARMLKAPELAVLRKYHVQADTSDYLVYSRTGQSGAALIAPDYLFIRDHAGYEIRSLKINSLEERSGNLIAHCLLDGRPAELLGENLADLLTRGEAEVAVSAEGSLLHRYTHPAGLFNYYEENGEFYLHYHPDFGRGEHAEFFNFWQRNLYGAFTPDSFIEIKPITRQESRALFKELRQAGVLNGRGHLRDGSLLEAHEFRSPAGTRHGPALRNFLTIRPRREQAENQFDTLLNRLPPELGREIAELNLLEGDPTGLTRLPADQRRVLLQLFVERIAAGVVATQIARNRGIVMQGENGAHLLLLSDSVASSSPFYGRLIGFGRSLAGEADCHIAYAYRDPIPRNPARTRHPLIEALRDFEKLRAVDGLDKAL